MVVRARPLLIGLAFLASAWIWRAHLSRRWTDRIPRGWSMSASFAGVQTNADPVTGRLPERDVLGEYLRSIRIISDTGRPAVVTLRDELTTKDPVSGHTTFQYIVDELVDPRTGERVEPQYRGDIAVFPREVKKRVYRYRANYAEGIPVAFEREDEVEGLRTYFYSYRGRADYGASYAGTPEFPGITLQPGQEIRCADDQFYLRMWVEPYTGALVKVDEGCPSGDYVYDRATGRTLAAVDRWSGIASGTALLDRVERVQSEKLTYLIASRVLPGALALLGAVAMLIGLAPALRQMPRS